MVEMVRRTKARLLDEWDGLLVLLAFAVWYLTNLRGALSIDEAIYAESGLGVFQGNPYLNPTHAIAPTAKYATGLTQALLGQSSFAVRLPAVLFGLGTLYVTYKLGRRFRGRWLGLGAMSLLGTTYVFAHYSVRMMLDVPLAFFFVASLLGALAYLDGETVLVGLVTGGLIAATATTKVYGLVYALPPALILLVGVTRRDDRSLRRSLRDPIVGGVVLLVAIYLPFAVFPHPPVAGAYAGTIEALLSLPVLGNYAYVVGQALAKNFLHLGDGHAVTVGNTIYQRPPVWTYGYWLYEQGGVLYVGALLSTVVAVPVAALRRERDLVALAWSVGFPLVALSLLTVKFPRYVLPLFPLLILGGLYSGAMLVRGVLHRDSSPQAKRSVRGYGIVIGSVLLLVLMPPSGITETTETPIREDSGFDEAAAEVARYAAESGDDDVVLTYHPSALDYYLGEREDVALVNIRPGDTGGEIHAELADRIRRGELDLAVVPSGDERLRGTELFDLITTTGVELGSIPTSPGGSELLVYELIQRENVPEGTAGFISADQVRTYRHLTHVRGSVSSTEYGC